MIDYFIDPVLRGPTLGSMLMCIASSLVGVIVYFQKKSLVGETLSHASYPGVVFGLFFSYFVLDLADGALFILLGGMLTSFLALYSINTLTRKFSVTSDSALCMILALFFGVGILGVSLMQFTTGGIYKQAESYLFGQTATMTDTHIYLYLALALFVITTVIIFYKELKTLLFDPEYAKAIGIPEKKLNGLITLLIVVSVVVSIRSVGVVLLSAILIAPAVSARQLSIRLKTMLWLAPLFGAISAFLGNLLSNEPTKTFSYGKTKVVFPTGPTIVIVAALICLASLLFAPKEGILMRFLQKLRFKDKVRKENLLKLLWKKGPLPTKETKTSSLHLKFIQYRGWIEHKENLWQLTKKGESQATHVIRLHRLWEVYLVDYMGMRSEKVHTSAEEMEHILTPELEQELTELLKNPKWDPHNQPIPPK